MISLFSEVEFFAPLLPSFEAPINRMTSSHRTLSASTFCTALSRAHTPASGRHVLRIVLSSILSSHLEMIFDLGATTYSRFSIP
jgi:hypothetical protein